MPGVNLVNVSPSRFTEDAFFDCVARAPATRNADVFGILISKFFLTFDVFVTS